MHFSKKCGFSQVRLCYQKIDLNKGMTVQNRDCFSQGFGLLGVVSTCDVLECSDRDLGFVLFFCWFVALLSIHCTAC